MSVNVQILQTVQAADVAGTAEIAETADGKIPSLSPWRMIPAICVMLYPATPTAMNTAEAVLFALLGTAQ